MTFTERNGISVAEIVVYVPILAIATFLGYRHGFGRSSGWYFLITFALLRIIGAGLQLGELRDPTTTSLYIGAAICQNIGFSPLLLVTVGLLSRVWESINLKKPSKVVSKVLQLIQLIVLVALVLGIYGGVKAGDDFSSTGKFTYLVESKVAVGLFVAGFVLLILAIIFTWFSLEHIEAGEKRLLLVITMSLPFLLVRLLYSCFSNFDTAPKWNTLTGSTTLLLCLAIIEEFIVVVLYEACGLTLAKRVTSTSASLENPYVSKQQHQPMQGNGLSKVGHFFATYTILGRFISRVSRRPSK